MNMCEQIYYLLDELFAYLEKNYPYKQSYKVTPEYIVDRYNNAKLPEKKIDFYFMNIKKNKDGIISRSRKVF